MIKEWLKRIIRRLLGRKEPEVAPEEEAVDYCIRPSRTLPPARRGIQATDLGMRKLRRHRSGRLHDRRSGFDPDKRMIDIEDDQTRKSRKKRTWYVDRKRRHDG